MGMLVRFWWGAQFHISSDEASRAESRSSQPALIADVTALQTMTSGHAAPVCVLQSLSVCYSSRSDRRPLRPVAGVGSPKLACGPSTKQKLLGNSKDACGT